MMELQERFLYHIWDEGHLIAELRTCSGKELRIKYQGHFNTNRGPDFINATLEMDSVACCGDVEIHLEAMDWLRHHHNEDHYYNNVILHVVYEKKQLSDFTIKANGELTEILELKPHLDSDIAKLIDSTSFSYPGRKSDYCDLLSLQSLDNVMLIVSEYGIRRFHNKVMRFNSMLMFTDFEQILYQGFMEALGYDKNKYNMLRLAQEFSYNEIREWHLDGMTDSELSAILICGSGLDSRCGSGFSADLMKSLKTSYEIQAFTAKKAEIDWQLFRIRPQNHPLYRIVNFSGYLVQSVHEGLLKTCIKYFETDSKGNANKAFHKHLCASAKVIDPAIGSSVVANIFVNIMLPIMYLYYQKTGDLVSKNAIKKLYMDQQSLSENHITTYMRSRYRSNLMLPPKAYLQQGLIELHYRFCQYHNCDQCVSTYKKDI